MRSNWQLGNRISGDLSLWRAAYQTRRHSGHFRSALASGLPGAVARCLNRARLSPSASVGRV